jgi:hypothetical protein
VCRLRFGDHLSGLQAGGGGRIAAAPEPGLAPAPSEPVVVRGLLAVRPMGGRAGAGPLLRVEIETPGRTDRPGEAARDLIPAADLRLGGAPLASRSGIENAREGAIPGIEMVNPYRAGQPIRMRLDRAERGVMEIYNSTGRAVARIAWDPSGTAATVSWDGRLANGDPAPGGAYHIRVTTDGQVLRRSFLLLR